MTDEITQRVVVNIEDIPKGFNALSSYKGKRGTHRDSVYKKIWKLASRGTIPSVLYYVGGDASKKVMYVLDSDAKSVTVKSRNIKGELKPKPAEVAAAISGPTKDMLEIILQRLERLEGFND